jgi:glycogen synthase kinase 3 beta
MSLQYVPVRVIGQGAFGIVYCAKCFDGSLVAIKRVKNNPRYKNREIEIMRDLNNRYIIRLHNYFSSSSKHLPNVYTNLVMDYLPESLHQFNISYRKERKYPPVLYVKLFAYQIFAGLHYLHSHGIAHRDIKPENILIDRTTGELKLCDFGSAKRILSDEPSVSYIASRFYRAPELVLGCTNYTSAVDIWAAGCCIAECLMSGIPLFIGDSSVGQLEGIAKLIGPPTDEDLKSFAYSLQFSVTTEQSGSLEGALPRHTPPDLVDLLTAVFVYQAGKRLTAVECLGHYAFEELFELDITMPSGKPLPVLERPRVATR